MEPTTLLRRVAIGAAAVALTAIAAGTVATNVSAAPGPNNVVKQLTVQADGTCPGYFVFGDCVPTP